MTTTNRRFKGNKAFLPGKICATCGRTMIWRKAWAKSWDQVRHCSAACRRRRAGCRGGS